MDFPPFFMDHIAGGRLLIGVIATLHVLINHPLAVGAYPIVLLLEWWGVRTKNPALDKLAYQITFVVFIVTTTVGALTGVGIWFFTSLAAPFAIGSLLRVFFLGLVCGMDRLHLRGRAHHGLLPHLEEMDDARAEAAASRFST